MDETPHVKLKRLKINRYRTIKPGTELHFSDGMNVLLGKNGAGKTTLLNLLAMVVSGNFYEARDEEFDVEFDIGSNESSGLLNIKFLNQKDSSTKLLNAQSQKDFYKSEFQIIYQSNNFQNSKNFKINSEQENRYVLTIDGSKRIHEGTLKGIRNPFTDSKLNFVSLIMPVSEEITGSSSFFGHKLPKIIQRMDEARGWLTEALQLENALISFARSAHLIAQSQILFPYDMVRAFMNVFSKNREIIAMIADSQDVPSLQRIVAALGYAKGQVILEQINTNKESVFFGNPRFHFTKHDGISVRLEQLSFGEQRLFAFYYYLACTSETVIADELTNGLHHEMISGCIAAIGSRQAFLATQNPLLLDHLEFKSIDEVRASFILCSKETSDGQEWMGMRQMSEDEGREFFGHYQVELKQVNAILRWLGLW